MPIPKIIAKFETSLASGISATSTTATLVSATTKNGTTLPTTTYGFVIDEGTTDEEYIIADVNGTALTNMVRGLSYEDTQTSITELKKTHRKGASIKITDHPALLYIIQVIKGEVGFDGVIKNPASRSITDPRHVIDKEYLEGVVVGGALDATTSVKGISKMSVAPAVASSPIAVGDNDPRIFTLADKNGMIGIVLPYAGSSAPSGFLLADGSAVSRSTYSSLFAVISTTYGAGDGSTTFNLPNLKGRIPVGKNSTDTEFDVLGETGGEKTHVLTESEMPSHVHNIFYSSTGSNPQGPISQNTSGGININTGSAGGSLAHNNLQPYITLNYIIKY